VYVEYSLGYAKRLLCTKANSQDIAYCDIISVDAKEIINTIILPYGVMHQNLKKNYFAFAQSNLFA